MLFVNKDNMFVVFIIGIVQVMLDVILLLYMDMIYMKEDVVDVMVYQIKLVVKFKVGGMKLLFGGDYGFLFNLNGCNVWDLELWVQYFNYILEEVLYVVI